MTGRILRIELRRSTAPWLALAYVTATLALLFLLTGPWTHGTGAWNEQWEGLVQWQRELLVITWPFVVGVGAWQGTRQRRSTMDELLSVVPRPVWHRVGVLTGAIAIALTVAILVPFAVGAVRVAGNASFLGLSWLPTLLVGILAVVAGALLGMGIGHLLPYLVTPPVVTVVAFALTAATQITQIPQAEGNPARSFEVRAGLLSPALQGAQTAYTTVATQVQIGQFLLYLGLAATGIGLLAVRGTRARIVSALPAVLGVAVALVVLPGQPALAYPALPAASAPVCDDHGPLVCVTAAHSRVLPEFTRQARAALAALAVLPDAPTSVREVPDLGPDVLASLSRPGNVLQVDLNNQQNSLWDGTRLDPDLLRYTMLAGAGTLPCYGYAVPAGASAAGVTRSRDEGASQTVTAYWLMGARTLPSTALPRTSIRYVSDLARSVWATLTAQPRAEQVRRVTAAREAGLTCQGDPLDVLVHGTSR
jgi:hypothetical protein